MVFIAHDLVPDVVGSGVGSSRDGCGIKVFIRRGCVLGGHSVVHRAASCGTGVDQFPCLAGECQFFGRRRGEGKVCFCNADIGRPSQRGAIFSLHLIINRVVARIRVFRAGIKIVGTKCCTILHRSPGGGIRCRNSNAMGGTVICAAISCRAAFYPCQIRQRKSIWAFP